MVKTLLRNALFLRYLVSRDIWSNARDQIVLSVFHLLLVNFLNKC